MALYQLEYFIPVNGKVPIIRFDRALTAKQIASIIDALTKEFEDVVELQYDHEDPRCFYIHATFFYTCNQRSIDNLRTRLRKILSDQGYKEL